MNKDRLLLSIVFAVSVSIIMGTQDAMAVTFNQFNDASKLVDISGTGTPLGHTDDLEIDIVTTVGRPGFFEAGDVCVGDNGAIAQGSCGDTGDLIFTNNFIPNAALFNGATSMAPFWDDLDAGAAGEVYWQETTVNGINTLIVQWHSVGIWGDVGDVLFQLQLYECGDELAARYVYPDVVHGGVHDNGASASIGYQVDQNNGYQFSFNQAVLADNDVIDLFHPLEVSCNPVGGEFLPIDSTALILAGAQTNAVWMLSALAVIGSVAFGALYITTKKN